jgi:hypothetical protein
MCQIKDFGTLAETDATVQAVGGTTDKMRASTTSAATDSRRGVDVGEFCPNTQQWNYRH